MVEITQDDDDLFDEEESDEKNRVEKQTEEEEACLSCHLAQQLNSTATTISDDNVTVIHPAVGTLTDHHGTFVGIVGQEATTTTQASVITSSATTTQANSVTESKSDLADKTAFTTAVVPGILRAILNVSSSDVSTGCGKNS